MMTREEFLAFSNGKRWADSSKEKAPGPVKQVFFEFAPYEDISYCYCEANDTIYESRYYIGD